MGESGNNSLEKALAYMCDLPKTYIEKLELDKDIFLSIMGHICEIEYNGIEKPHAPKYMQLDFEVVQRYCLQGFPPKYVYECYSQYRRTINAAILIYCKALTSDGCEFSDSEYEKLFGPFFLDEEALKELKEYDFIYGEDEKDRIKKEKQSGYLLKTFKKNWKEKFSCLLEAQIKNSQIILNNFMPSEKFEKLGCQGIQLNRVLNFLNKLETESHDRHSDSTDVLVPYEEYHALHEMLLENPGKKKSLQKKHKKIVNELEHILAGKIKNKPD